MLSLHILLLLLLLEFFPLALADGLPLKIAKEFFVFDKNT